MTLWHASLLDAAHGATPGETSVPSGTGQRTGRHGYGDVKPEVGITGTPVIDPVVEHPVCREQVRRGQRAAHPSASARPESAGRHRKSGSPAAIDSSIVVAGTGDGSSNSQVHFDPQNAVSAPGLAAGQRHRVCRLRLPRGPDPYHGWVIGIQRLDLAPWCPMPVFNSTPNHVGSFTYSRGGIWMSGGAPAVDCGRTICTSPPATAPSMPIPAARTSATARSS